MKINRILVAILAAVVLSSCIDDKTNTNLKSLVKPILVNPDKDPAKFIDHQVYSVKRGDEINITPQIEYHDMNDLAYEWKINGKVVSTNKDLKWTFSPEIKEEKLFGMFSIYSKKAGNADIYSFTITQYIPFQAGYTILARKEGKIYLHFYQDILPTGVSAYAYELVPNAAEMEFPGTGNDSKIVEYWSRETNVIIGELMYVDSNPENIFSLDGKKLTKQPYLKSEFRGKVFPEALTSVRDVMHTAIRSYVLSGDNKLYHCLHGDSYYTGFYYDKPVQLNGKALDITHLCPPAKCTNAAAAMYNEKTDKFYGIYTGYTPASAGELPAKEGSIVEITALSGKASGKTLLWWKNLKDASSGGIHQSIALYKGNTNGKYYLRQISFEYDGTTVSAAKDSYAGVFAEIDDINENSVIYVMHNVAAIGGGPVQHIIYTNGVDHKTIYIRSRGDSGVGEADVFTTFDKDVVAICTDKIGRTHGNVLFGFDDGTIEHYVVVNGDRPNGFVQPIDKSLRVVTDKAEGVDLGEILEIKFKYGQLSAAS